MNTLVTIFRIPELRRKIFITLLFLAVYRIGFYVPLPMIDQAKLSEKMANAEQGLFGQSLALVSMFSGGNLSQAAIFALGIMPYISASIIFQLLSNVYPPLERLKKEGTSGQKKINEYTRYATVPICLIQSIFLVRYLMVPGGTDSVVVSGYDTGFNFYFYGFTAVLTMTAGTIFLMWLGEQIDEYGIGNGISLIIMAGIVARLPDAVQQLLLEANPNAWLGVQIKESIRTLGSTDGISFEKLLLLAALFLFVVVGVVIITKGQRRIPTQSARHVRGRRVYGGTRQFLPLKVNQAGVMPVIFASSLLLLPGMIFLGIASVTGATWANDLAIIFQRQGYVYMLIYIAMIYLFCYFWVAITFNPKEMADNLKDYGSFIPGYRPGKRTADYLERVLLRITYVGAAFLAVVAIIPNLVNSTLDIDWTIASFFGGTGLLIVVSVALDLVQKINSHLVMRNYSGLTDE